MFVRVCLRRLKKCSGTRRVRRAADRVQDVDTATYLCAGRRWCMQVHAGAGNSDRKYTHLGASGNCKKREKAPSLLRPNGRQLSRNRVI